MDAITWRFAALHRARLLENYEEWRTERSRGWVDRCRHGVYIGDPYGPDYMCGMCESSDLSPEHEILIAALDIAHQLVASMNERSAAVQALYTLDAPLDDTTRKALGEWIWDTVSRDVERMSERLQARNARRAGWLLMAHGPAPLPPDNEAREAQAHYDDTWR